jgi:hypothetical protein
VRAGAGEALTIECVCVKLLQKSNLPRDGAALRAVMSCWDAVRALRVSLGARKQALLGFDVLVTFIFF